MPEAQRVDRIAEAKASFLRDVAQHQMTVLHNVGLYRHLRFADPRRNGYWFDVVTWPGALAVRGDMGGGYVFARQPDMFEFFRRNGNQAGINPGYWAQKLESRVAGTVTEFSEDQLLEWAYEQVEEYAAERYPALRDEYEAQLAEYHRLHDHRSATVACQVEGCSWPRRYAVVEAPPAPAYPDDLRRMVAEAYEDGETGDDQMARSTLVARLERAKVCSGTWEVSFGTYSYPYLWFCHALVWAIAAYDRGHTVPEPAEEKPATVPAGRMETVQVASGVL